MSYERYKRMSDAMVGTGRDIWYSMCNWGQDQAWNWATSISNSYRCGPFPFPPLKLNACGTLM